MLAHLMGTSQLSSSASTMRASALTASGEKISSSVSEACVIIPSVSKSFLFYNNFKGIDDILYRIMNMSFLLVSLPTQIGAGRENGGRKKLTGLYRVLYPCIGLTSLLS